MTHICSFKRRRKPSFCLRWVPVPGRSGPKRLPRLRRKRLSGVWEVVAITWQMPSARPIPPGGTGENFLNRRQ